MTMATICEAKTRPWRPVEAARAGGDATIIQGRSGEEFVGPVPAVPSPGTRRLGRLKDESSGGDPLACGFWKE